MRNAQDHAAAEAAGRGEASRALAKGCRLIRSAWEAEEPGALGRLGVAEREVPPHTHTHTFCSGLADVTPAARCVEAEIIADKATAESPCLSRSEELFRSDSTSDTLQRADSF